MAKFHRIVCKDPDSKGFLHMVLGDLGLPVPAINLEAGKPTFWFTDLGMNEFGHEAANSLKEHGFRFKIETGPVNNDEVIYQDEYQIAV